MRAGARRRWPDKEERLTMNHSEECRNARRDKKRHAAKYNPVRHSGVKGFSKYEWFQRKQKKEEA